MHLARRRLRRTPSQFQDLFETYAGDGIRAIDASTQEHHSALTSCINCGLCAFAARRIGKASLPDLASSYMRMYARLGEASSDLAPEDPDLAAASAVCPVGVPLQEVAAAVRRFTRS